MPHVSRARDEMRVPKQCPKNLETKNLACSCPQQEGRAGRSRVSNPTATRGHIFGDTEAASIPTRAFVSLYSCTAASDNVTCTASGPGEGR